MSFIEKAISEGDPERYSLILTDCSMPFMDGYKATEKIRQMLSDAWDAQSGHSLSESDRKRLKIIAITGHVEPEYLKKAQMCGMDKVYPKPLPIYELAVMMLELGLIQTIPDSILKMKDC